MRRRAGSGTATAVFFALLALCACVPVKVSEGGGLLALPYDAAAPEPSRDPVDCPPPASAPMRDLVLESIYKKSDPRRATVDRAAREVYLQETGDAQRFENALLRMSNTYLRTGARGAAACVLGWLDGWAKGGALLGRTSDQGVAARQWMLASFGSAYAQVRDAPGLNAGQVKRVERWLKKCAGAVIADYPPDALQGRKFNNHLYWAAWAVTVTGIALDDRDLYGWGIARAEWVLQEQVADDGALPLEMARGRKALQYHMFAAAPLVMLAEAGARNGDDLYAIRGGVLNRLVDRVVEGLKDPSFFAAGAGVKQLSAASLHEGHFGWMEAYGKRFPSAALKRQLDRRRPVFFRQTGGDMTFLYR